MKLGKNMTKLLLLTLFLLPQAFSQTECQEHLLSKVSVYQNINKENIKLLALKKRQAGCKRLHIILNALEEILIATEDRKPPCDSDLDQVSVEKVDQIVAYVFSNKLQDLFTNYCYQDDGLEKVRKKLLIKLLEKDLLISEIIEELN